MSKKSFSNNCTTNNIICRNKTLLINILIISIISYSFILKGLGYTNIAFFFKCIGFFGLASSVTNWLALQIILEKLSFLFTINKVRLYLLPLKNLLTTNIFAKKDFESLKIKCKDKCGDILNKEDKQKINESISNLEFVHIMTIFKDSENAKKLSENIIKNIYEIETDIKIKIEQGLNEEDENKKGNQFFNEEILPIIENRIEMMITTLQSIINGAIKNYFQWLVLWGAFCGMGFAIFFHIFECYIK